MSKNKMLEIIEQDMVIPDTSVCDVVMIQISKLVPFDKHPFKVIDDEAMEMLVESIKDNGILTPIHVREKSNDLYEIVSGHRRVHAIKRLGREEIPAVIDTFDDDAAVIAMVDSNIQRELLPSERAYSLKMKLEAIKHQGKASRHNVEKSRAVSADVVGQSVGLSGRQVNRYVKLTKLVSRLLDKVDDKTIPVSIGIKIADLPECVQSTILDYIESGCKLNDKLVDRMLEKNKNGQDASSVLSDSSENIVGKRTRVVINKKAINRYFPDEMSIEEIEHIIYELIKEWAKK